MAARDACARRATLRHHGDGAVGPIPGTTRIVTQWFCVRCEVAGRDPDPDPACWSCGRHGVTVTARPVVAPD